ITSAQNTISAQSSFNETRTSDPIIIADTNAYYSNGVFPTTGITLHTINYYDTYTDLLGYVLPDVVYGQELTDATQGLPIVSKVRVLNDQNDWITSVTGYDDKARPIYGASLNTYLNTQDISETLLDFTGKVVESRATHQKGSHKGVVTIDYFTYDHQNRLITHMQQIDDEPVQLITSNIYDELGQLESKHVGGQLFESGYTDLVGVEEINGGTILQKNIAGNSYNAGFATIGELEENGGLSFTIPNPEDEIRVGLSDINNSVSPTDIDYMFILTPITTPNVSRYRVYTRKADGSFGSPHVDATYTIDSNSFSIEKEGTQLHFIQHGVVVYSHTLLDPNTSLIGDVSLKTPNAQISNIHFYATTIDKSLQKVDYKYNVRGWLTDINDINSEERTPPLFNFHINYDDTVKGDAGAPGQAVPLYNGNISQTIWKSANTDSKKRTYGYKYDALNRINTAYSRKGVDLMEYDHYNVSGINYDKNGNIQALTRQGDYNGNALTMDDLTYTYLGNQLLEVSDNGHANLKKNGFFDGNTSEGDYVYDVNGNMIADKNKGITTIAYNYLNLPTFVKINTIDAEENVQDGTITYIYDATGIKLAKVLRDNITLSTVTTSYAGGYIYEDTNGLEALQLFSHPEGYVTPVTIKDVAGHQYAFNYTDHLGNVRLTYADSDGDGTIDPTTEIISEKNYYPFGLQQQGYNDVVTSNSNSMAERFMFNGKENNSELGLEFYDFGARNYEASLGRWMNIDPLAEAMRRHSPYNFAFDNPVYFTDPDGMMPQGNCDWCKQFFVDWTIGTNIGHRNFVNNTVDGALLLLNLSGINGIDLAQGNFQSIFDRTGAVVEGAVVGAFMTAYNTVDGAGDVIDGRVVEGAAKMTEGFDNAVLAAATEGVLRGIPASKTAVPSVAEQVVTEARRVNPNVNTTTLTPGPNAGRSIQARSKSQSFRAGEKSAINEIGATDGCHTCGSTTSGRASGNFTPDHQPVSSLVPDGTPQQLYPHCASCSSSQGGITGGLIRRGYDSSRINGVVTPFN
ncbi:RHS repeat-associated core domain-containing protein, partial [Dokdonia sp.]